MRQYEVDESVRQGYGPLLQRVYRMGTPFQISKFEDKNGQYAASKKAYPSQRASH
jgi:hypothetical protein